MPYLKDRRARARQTFLSLEQLEERTVLAGNITATITAGSLRLIGDAQDNQVLVQRTGTTSLQLSSLDGTTRINGQSGPVTLSNFTAGITASTGNGNDLLRFSGSSTDLFRVFGNAMIDTGSGDDTVQFSNFSVWNSLTLTTGTGNDKVLGVRDFAGVGTNVWGLRVGQDAVINTGTGDDSIELRNSAILRNFVLDANAGNDRVDLRNNDFQRLSVLNGGIGTDSLNNVGNTFRYAPTIYFFETRSAIAGPNAAADSATLAENGTTTINVLANDSASSGTINTSSVVVTQQPARGTAIVNANGSITYTNNGAEAASDTFRYTVRDTQGNTSNEGIVSLTITPVNDLPVAVNDTVTVNEGASASLNVTTNDVDAEGQLNRNSIVILTQPANGTVAIGANGNVTYTHGGSETTSDSFTYTIADALSGVSNIATVNVVVVPVNDLPTIVPPANVTVNEDAQATATVTVGDAETPVGQLTLTATSSNQNIVANAGIVVGVNGNQRSLTITPVPNATGTVTINLAVNDGTATVTSSFTVTFNAENDLPTISQLADISGAEDSVVAPLAVTVSDVETAAGALVVTALSSDPNIATVTVAAGANANQRTVIVTPVANATGQTTITVTVTDGAGAAVNEQFTVNLTPVNDAPITLPDALTVNEGASGTVNVLINDVDVDGAIAANTVALVNAPDHGIATVDANGVFTYTHDGGNTVTDSFTYTVTDNQSGVSLETTVFVTINPTNDLPTITGVANVTVDEDTVVGPLTVTLTDEETAASNLVVTATSSNGTLIPQGNIAISTTGSVRTITITPAANESGSSLITLTVTDTGNPAASATTTFTVTVNPVLDPPTISAIADTTIAVGGTVNPIPFTVTDPDTDQAALQFSVTSSNSALVNSSNVVILGTGPQRTIQIVPEANATGSSDITISVSDGTTTVNETFTFTVNAAPTIRQVPDIVVDEDQPIPAFQITIDDAETADAALGVSVASSNPSLVPVANVVVTGNTGLRTVVVTPVTNAFGTATITLTVTDANGLTAQEQFLVTVNPVNDLPTIVAIADLTTQEDVATTPIALTIGDVETPASSLIVSVTSSNTAVVANSPAALVLGGSGGARTLVVAPVANASGSTIITVSVTDGNNVTTTEEFTLTVNPVNDAPVTLPDSDIVFEDSTVNIAVLSNDLDVDAGGSLNPASVTIVNGPAYGTVQIETDGSITYTHTGALQTHDSFTYTVRDNTGAISAATAVDIAIELINDPPEVVDDSFSIRQGAPLLSGNLLTNGDTDEETPNGLFIFSIETDDLTDPDDPTPPQAVVGVPFRANYGTVRINANGTFTYDLDDSSIDFLPPDIPLFEQIPYLVSDGGGATSAGLLTINITTT
jgi:VCBS repeat-containing protein